MTTPPLTRRSASFTAILCALLACGGGVAVADDWPQAGHDAGQTNHVSAPGLRGSDLRDLRASGTLAFPGDVTGFVVADGDVFATWTVPDPDGPSPLGGGMTRVGLDGTPVWSIEGSCVLSSPSVAGDAFLFRSSRTFTGCITPNEPPIVAVDAATGATTWWSESMMWYLPAGDRVFATPATIDDQGGYRETSLRAVDPVSGAPLWSHPVDPARALHFDPIASSEALFVTFDIDPIQAYDPQTGELLWSRALQRPGAWRSVAADSGRVYVERTPYSTGDETVHLIAMSSSDGATLWARRLEPGPNPELLEPNPVQGISVSPDSVVVAQGTGIEALDPVDGALLWQRDIQGAWGLSGAGRFAFVTRQRPNGTHAVTVLDAATGRRVAGLPIPAEHQVIFVGGRLLWAKGGTIHIWR